MSQADAAAAAFPTLDTDLDAGQGVPGPPKRVCIATPDILGPIRNGGIGTAYHHVARMLAAWGHEVVIAYVNPNAADTEAMAAARDLYAGFGVALEPIVPCPGSDSPLRHAPAPTWALLDWLRARERPFDIVHVSEWRGLGYGPLLAKALGLDFGTTHFVVKGSSPTLWSLEGNRQLASTEAELGWVFMERRSVELADTVICGSAHLLGWMRDAGYELPARAFVWPNVFPAPDPDPAAVAARAALDGAPLREVVFFGRLEPRKGLVLFADAVARLARQRRAPERVTFLGKPVGTFDALAFIERTTSGWPGEVRVLTEYGAAEAVAYLAAEPGRLAVIPSLLENASIAVTECLQAGIPFVAAATGGTPELVDPADHARALVPPDHAALGDRLAELAAAPLRAVRPRRDFAAALDVWQRWHAQSAPFAAAAERFVARARQAAAETPRVTVCLVHHERPALLRMAADSVLAQDYPNLDAVLVDDGSENPAARAALDAVEADFAPRGWRVIRQENRYLGAARNAAAAAAEGEWLLFLDDDNVLFPDAVSRLARAACFSGADCVPAASICFTGDGDPRTDAASHDMTIRFLGAARTWNRIRNVAGDACALIRRDVFEAAGGFTDVYGLGLEDLELFNRLMVAGRRLEPLPDPVYYYRKHAAASMIDMMEDRYQAEACRARALGPHLEGLPADERAYGAYNCATTKQLGAARHTLGERAQRIADQWRKLDAAQRTLGERRQLLSATEKQRDDARRQLGTARRQLDDARQQRDATRQWLDTTRQRLDTTRRQLDTTRRQLDDARRGHLLALARRRWRLGFVALEAVVRPTAEWLAEARERSPGPTLELRRNGRVLARAGAPGAAGDTLRIPVPPARRGVGEALYSVHDAATGVVLATLTAPAVWRGRRVQGAVESRSRPEIRGWLLDPDRPGRRRRVAVELDGRLCDVVVAGNWRNDIARWLGTDGLHGFLWRVPAAAADGTRVTVFDADTGRPLRGSPVRLEDGKVAASRTDAA